MTLNLVQGERNDLGIGARAGAGDQEFGPLEIGERLHLGRMPGHGKGRLAVHAAEPGEPQRIEPRLVLTEHRLEGKTAADRPDDAAVLGGDPVEIINRLEAAGAEHVLHDERRIAGNVTAEVAHQQARVEVVGRAGPRKHDHRDLAALVELLRRLRPSKAGGATSESTRESQRRREP